MSKQLKSALKATKQAIQSKSYDKALEYCKEALQCDPKTYNGLVFHGLCLAELHQKEESSSSYHNAIAEQPDQLLAYQGLINLYTKHWVAKLTVENTEDLISAYKSMIRLTGSNDEKKMLDLHLQVSKAYYSIKKFKDSLDSLSVANRSYAKSDENLNLIYTEVLECLKLAAASFSDLQIYWNLVFTSVKQVCSQLHSDVAKKEESLKLLFLFLQHDKEKLQDNMENIILLCLSICQTDQKSAFVTEVLIQIYLQNENLFSEDVLKSYENLLEIYSGPYKNLIQGYMLYQSKKYEECAKSFTEGINTCPDFVPARALQCKAYLQMHKYTSAEAKTRNALQLCKTLQTTVIEESSSWIVRLSSISEIKLQLTLCLAQALCGSCSNASIKLGISTYEKLVKIWPTSAQPHLGLAKACIKLQDWSSARSHLECAEGFETDNLELKCWRAYINFMDNDRRTALRELEEITGVNTTCFLAHFLLGKLMWEIGDMLLRRDKSKCLSMFLKAAKLDVFYGETFLYLGHFYHDIANDQTRAIKCYEKAYNLNSHDETIGATLADQYVAAGNYASAISLYQSITNAAPAGTCKWAWLRLGLCKLKTNDAPAAIKCFQAALRADAIDHVCWECLGEGYLNRGSYTAAWKAFNRAHELEPSSVYSIYQMAAIKQILCQYTDAVSEYMDVLDIVSDYVPALTGLGESHLSLAKFMLSEGRDLTCVDHVNKAIKFLTQALQARGSMCCVWKLLGDCCSMIFPLHHSDFHICVPAVLVDPQNIDASHTVELNKLQALQLGEKCYTHALYLHNDPTLWHDLGQNYFWQAKENGGDVSAASTLANKSIAVFQKAIAMETQNHVFWNSLGVTCSSKLVKNYELAQHSFIKSIQCEPNNAQAWTNLGALYLEHSHVELAHKAFKTAQSLDPSFINSWIGQAMIAESIGSEEAMDLFRHATELGLHGQAGAGYAAWVCNTISECQDRGQIKYKENIHDLNALAAAATQLHKYCTRHPQHTWALVLYGFVLEQSGLNWSAEEVYKQALDQFQLQVEVCEMGDGKPGLIKQLNNTRSDYARLLWKNKKYSESVAVYRTISPLNQWRDICGLALALYQCGDLVESYTVFEQANQLAENDDERILVIVAMAVLSWKQNETKRAVELLRSCGNHRVEAVQALCALGIIENDAELIDSTLHELVTYDMSKKKGSDVIIDNCLFIAAGLMRKDIKQARSYIQKCIHRFPTQWRFRNLLSQFLATSEGGSSTCLLYACAKQGRESFEADESALPTQCDVNNRSLNRCQKDHEEALLTFTASILSAGKHNLATSGKCVDSLKACQRMLHSHPYSIKAISLLVGGCYARSVITSLQRKAQSQSLGAECQRYASFVSGHSDGELWKWAIKQNMLSCLSEHQHETVTRLASKISGDKSEVDTIHALSKCNQQYRANQAINQDLLSEMENMNRSPSATGLVHKLLFHCYECNGMLEAAHSRLSEQMQRSEKRNERLYCALRMGLLAVEASRKDGDQRDLWCAKARDAADIAVKLSGNSPLAELLDGLCYESTKNRRKSCSTFNKVLNNPASFNNLCLCKNIAAWYLYKAYHGKNDKREMEKLLEKWKKFELSVSYLDKLKELLPLEKMS